jgi:sulfur-carrier protein
MPIRVAIPTPFRRFTGGETSLESSAATLPELLDELEDHFPELKRHLRDEAGQLRPFLSVYVNEEDIRFLGGSQYRFKEDDEVVLVPSIAGG